MFIREDVWNKIREQFSESEKTELRTAVTGEAICPRGFEVDRQQLSVQPGAFKVSVAIQ